MIVWSEKLYIGGQAETHYETVRKKLDAGKTVPGFFLITEPSNQSNLFDILPAEELRFPYYKRREILVYGIAKGKTEAEELVVSMLQDVYCETDGLCCKEYFKTK